MGHKGDMEATYTTHKGRLPQEVIEDMRGSYASCEEYLSSRLPSRTDPELTTIKTMVERARARGGRRSLCSRHEAL